MAACKTDIKSAEERRGQSKSTGFSAPAAEARKRTKLPEEEAEPTEREPSPDINRDDSLALIERLEMGPQEFKPNVEDPEWNLVEPNSKIRLRFVFSLSFMSMEPDALYSKRTLSHEDLQEHLTARFYLPPSILYSIVRPGRSGSELEVPVDGDFVIIGVLAEKSDIKMTARPAQQESTRKDKSKDKQQEKERKEDEADEGLGGADSDTEKEAAPVRKAKRFIIFKLLDMRKAKGGSSSNGDGILSVIMFESDSSTITHDAVSDDDELTASGVHMRKEASSKNGKKESFRGGSGGAYEKFWKAPEGTVVAIMNPKVLKPRQVRS